MLLTELAAGEAGIVSRLHAKSGIRRRLMDIGLIEGTRVECLMFSPLGDPAAYLIRGAVIALRKKDADTVEIARAGD